eukprot:6556097-Heterocapsa_arctica.AAC.1
MLVLPSRQFSAALDHLPKDSVSSMSVERGSTGCTRSCRWAPSAWAICSRHGMRSGPGQTGICTGL